MRTTLEQRLEFYKIVLEKIHKAGTGDEARDIFLCNIYKDLHNITKLRNSELTQLFPEVCKHRTVEEITEGNFNGIGIMWDTNKERAKALRKAITEVEQKIAKRKK